MKGSATSLPGQCASCGSCNTPEWRSDCGCTVIVETIFHYLLVAFPDGISKVLRLCVTLVDCVSIRGAFECYCSSFAWHIYVADILSARAFLLSIMHISNTGVQRLHPPFPLTISLTIINHQLNFLLSCSKILPYTACFTDTPDSSLSCLAGAMQPDAGWSYI